MLVCATWGEWVFCAACARLAPIPVHTPFEKNHENNDTENERAKHIAAHSHCHTLPHTATHAHRHGSQANGQISKLRQNFRSKYSLLLVFISFNCSMCTNKCTVCIKSHIPYGRAYAPPIGLTVLFLFFLIYLCAPHTPYTVQHRCARSRLYQIERLQIDSLCHTKRLHEHTLTHTHWPNASPKNMFIRTDAIRCLQHIHDPSIHSLAFFFSVHYLRAATVKSVSTSTSLRAIDSENWNCHESCVARSHFPSKLIDLPEIHVRKKETDGKTAFQSSFVCPHAVVVRFLYRRTTIAVGFHLSTVHLSVYRPKCCVTDAIQ